MTLVYAGPDVNQKFLRSGSTTLGLSLNPGIAPADPLIAHEFLFFYFSGV
jgi:hypothetical protein